MCGRYVSPETAAIEREWQIQRSVGTLFGRRYNVAPSMTVSLVRRSRDSAGLELADARWGFAPAWWKPSKPPAKSYNAVSEGAAARPMWRDAYRSTRCLIPALGWYEWARASRTDPNTGEIHERKQPYYLFVEPDCPAGFAGLMSTWAAPGKAPLLTCAILTRPASPSAAAVHDRMPVVLDRAAHGAWLDPQLVDPAKIEKILETAAVAKIRCYAVPPLVNSSKVDGPELIAPLS